MTYTCGFCNQKVKVVYRREKEGKLKWSCEKCMYDGKCRGCGVTLEIPTWKVCESCHKKELKAKGK